jgi:hypothetical protein
MHDATTKRRSSRINLKWAWNVSEPELLALITSKKNIIKSTNNFKAMIGATRAQLLK